MNSFSVSSIIDNFSEYILCFYINITIQIQILKITNIPNYHWKQVIFPGQRLVFEAVTSAKLEIYTNESDAAIPREVIPCQYLRIIDEIVSVKHFL